MSTVPHSASELYEIVTTGTGRDTLDAVDAMNATYGEFLTGIMMRSALNALRDESEYPPSGCFWCDRGQCDHARQYVGGPGGYHEWTPPTQRQIRDRMLERRFQRKGAL